MRRIVIESLLMLIVGLPLYAACGYVAGGGFGCALVIGAFVLGTRLGLFIERGNAYMKEPAE